MTDTDIIPTQMSARDKLLAAGFQLIRSKGYSGTTVDDLCAAAGVTKGAFFHHFRSKEALGVAAADFWAEFTGRLFAEAPYHAHADPLDRFTGYLDFRRQLLAGELPDYTCLVGTMVQETYLTAPAIRDACEASISGHARTLEPDIQAAMDARGMGDRGWTAGSLALHTQAVLQGAFILAKAQDSVTVAVESVDHLKRYVALLFSPPGGATAGNG
ncbi:TetR family transcriptional regulator [Hoeflea marina]|uniref:TetR family transcriptional regulator n=1 Tax=Hoeflea marina TaxID=274592 RepID=A0A317PRJ7_9HYPH|nr:TetR/AcrR family transcriptional regulator [Hoeflea marina]PWW03365.1 TetR family transcriptional regulator [Hoeflea marina]